MVRGRKGNKRDEARCQSYAIGAVLSGLENRYELSLRMNKKIRRSEGKRREC